MWAFLVEYLRQSSNFSAASARVRNQVGVQALRPEVNRAGFSGGRFV